MFMALQLTVLFVFIGLALYMAAGLSKRTVMFFGSFGAGVILFMIITTVSNVYTQATDLISAGQKSGFVGSTWLFLAIAFFGILALPFFLVFVVGERRRSMIIAIAFGLFNFGMSLSLAGDFATGLITITWVTFIATALLFLTEGVSMASIIMGSKPEILYVLGLGLTAVGPAALGFNLSGARSLDIFVPFMNAACAGFMVFYLPFILGAGKTPEEVKTHFAGILTGLMVIGTVMAAVTVIGR